MQFINFSNGIALAKVLTRECIRMHRKSNIHPESWRGDKEAKPWDPLCLARVKLETKSSPLRVSVIVFGQKWSKDSCFGSEKLIGPRNWEFETRNKPEFSQPLRHRTKAINVIVSKGSDYWHSTT